MKCRHGPSLEPVVRMGIGQPENLWACSRCGRRFAWGLGRWACTIPECRVCGREIVTEVLCGRCDPGDVPADAKVHPFEFAPAEFVRPRPTRTSSPQRAAAVLARLSAAVLSRGYRWTNERELQEGLRHSLDQGAPGEVEREVRLTPHDRIDFLVGDVGVEVKVDGSLASVTRQLHRYAQVEELAGVLLVTTQACHLAVPRELNGKPIVVARLIGGIS